MFQTSKVWTKALIVSFFHRNIMQEWILWLKKLERKRHICNMYLEFCTEWLLKFTEALVTRCAPSAVVWPMVLVQVFEMRRFIQNIAQEMKGPYLSRRKLELQCITNITFGRNDANHLESPCWIMVVNIVALDMLRSKLPEAGKNSTLVQKNFFLQQWCSQCLLLLEILTWTKGITRSSLVVTQQGGLYLMDISSFGKKTVFFSFHFSHTTMIHKFYWNHQRERYIFEKLIFFWFWQSMQGHRNRSQPSRPELRPW